MGGGGGIGPTTLVGGARGPQPRRNGGCRAAAGAARSAIQVPGIVSRAVSTGLRGRQNAQLGCVRLADRHQPSSVEPLCQVGIHGGAEVALLQITHSQVQRLAGEGAAKVLEQEGNAPERTAWGMTPTRLEALSEEGWD